MVKAGSVFFIFNKKHPLRMSMAATLKIAANVLTVSILDVPLFSMRRICLTLYPTRSAKSSWVRWHFSRRFLIDLPIMCESIK